MNSSPHDYKRTETYTLPSTTYNEVLTNPARVSERTTSILNDTAFRDRHPNRETRLANMLFQHIQNEKKWTSGVDRPFVLGI